VKYIHPAHGKSFRIRILHRELRKQLNYLEI
jgi:hypothetical protein